MSETSKIIKDRIRINLIKLMSGSVGAQIIIALSTPILTRLYTPEAFGVAAIFSATYGLLIPVISLKYDQAIIIPKSNSSAKALGASVIIVSTFNCFLVALIVLLYLFFSLNKSEYHLLLLPVALWFGSAYTLMQQWSSRMSNYSHYANSQIIGSISNITVCLGLALSLTGDPVFLVLGFATGMGVSLVVTIAGFRTWPYKLKKYNYRTVGRRLKAYLRFPTFVLPTAVITVIGINAIPIIVAFFYSLDDVGVFSIANRVLMVPAAIVGGSLAEAVRSEFAACQRTRLPVTPVFKKVFLPIVILAGTLFGIIYFVPPNVFSLIFGKSYANSAIIAQALILAIFSHFISAPFAYVFAILHRPLIGLYGQTLLAIMPAIGLVMSSLNNSTLLQSLYIYSFITLAGAAVMLYMAFRECRSFDSRNFIKY